jgi:SAM-dependent methyltransferase
MNEKLKHKGILQEIGKYYTEKVTDFGANHLGVDWKSQESQNLRFDQLLKITGDDRDSSVIDFGCGYGAMGRYMRELGYKGQYIGYDISDAMINTARKEQSDLLNSVFINNIIDLPIADYTIASGIFNVKGEFPENVWLDYVMDTIGLFSKHSRKGFAFNMLTSFSDPGKMRSNLYYADPGLFVNHCIANCSPFVALHHRDYGLYEFTIEVRHN